MGEDWKTQMRAADAQELNQDFLDIFKEADEDQDESKEEKKMTETILQRLQFTLLSLVKSGGVNKNKKKGDRKTPVEGVTYKELYGETLKCSSSSPDFTSNLHTLLVLVKAERGKLI